jgi:hypothetical protein
MLRPMLVAVAIMSLTGCPMAAGKAGSRSLSKSIKPESFNDSDMGMNTGDPWIQQAAAEGRGGRGRETVSDPLGLRKNLMSPETRSIEANLGIDEN